MSSLSILAFFLFATNAGGIGDSAGKSADQLIDESNGVITSSDHPKNPKEARSIWGIESEANSISPAGIRDESTSANSSGASSDEQEKADMTETATTSGVAGYERAEPSGGFAASTVDMAGDWSFRLRDSKSRVMALTLYQSEDAVFGTGSINDGGDSMKISASGRWKNDSLSLDAVSLGTVIFYRMAIVTDGRSASGDYRAFWEEEPAWNGTVEGSRLQTQREGA